MWILIILIYYSYHTALMKDDNYYLYVFLKECKYIEKKVIRYTNTKFEWLFFF